MFFDICKNIYRYITESHLDRGDTSVFIKVRELVKKRLFTNL